MFLLSGCSDKVMNKVFTFDFDPEKGVQASVIFYPEGKFLIGGFAKGSKPEYLFDLKAIEVGTYTKEENKYSFTWLGHPFVCNYENNTLNIAWGEESSFIANEDNDYLRLKKTNDFIGKKYTLQRSDDKPDDVYIFINEEKVLYITYGRNDGVGIYKYKDYEIDGKELYLDGYTFEIEKDRLKADVYGTKVTLREKGEVSEADIAEAIIEVEESKFYKNRE